MHIRRLVFLSCLALTICPRPVISMPAPWLLEEGQKHAEKNADYVVTAIVRDVTQYFSSPNGDGLSATSSIVMLEPIQGDAKKAIAVRVSAGPLARYCWRDKLTFTMKAPITCRLGVFTSMLASPPSDQELPDPGSTITAWLKTQADGSYAPIHGGWNKWHKGYESQEQGSSSIKANRKSHLDVKVTGIVSDVDNGCIVDRTCSVLVDGLEVVTGNGLNQAERYLDRAKHVDVASRGDQVEVYCGIRALPKSSSESAIVVMSRGPAHNTGLFRAYPSLECSLYGSIDYYLKNRSNTIALPHIQDP